MQSVSAQNVYCGWFSATTRPSFIFVSVKLVFHHPSPQDEATLQVLNNLTNILKENCLPVYRNRTCRNEFDWAVDPYYIILKMTENEFKIKSGVNVDDRNGSRSHQPGQQHSWNAITASVGGVGIGKIWRYFVLINVSGFNLLPNETLIVPSSFLGVVNELLQLTDQMNTWTGIKAQ